jgi:serine/threonine protein phosphatase 1
MFGKKSAEIMDQPRRSRIDVAPQDYVAIYALSDIHGCHDALVEAERRIVEDAERLPGRKLMMLLGDYVDRGPRSSDVLAHLCAPPPADFGRFTLCGNHDDVFLKFLDDPDANSHWLEFGAPETAASYGLDLEYILLTEGRSVRTFRDMLVEAMPPEHIDLLRSLPTAVTVGHILFVHAGIRPGIPLEDQSDEDLIWIREPFLTQGPLLPCLVVHGHTPGPIPVFGNRRIGIDTAAAMGGSLTVLKITADERTILTQVS